MLMKSIADIGSDNSSAAAMISAIKAAGMTFEHNGHPTFGLTLRMWRSDMQTQFHIFPYRQLNWSV